MGNTKENAKKRQILDIILDLISLRYQEQKIRQQEAFLSFKCFYYVWNNSATNKSVTSSTTIINSSSCQSSPGQSGPRKSGPKKKILKKTDRSPKPANRLVSFVVHQHTAPTLSLIYFFQTKKIAEPEDEVKNFLAKRRKHHANKTLRSEYNFHVRKQKERTTVDVWKRWQVKKFKNFFSISIALFPLCSK